MINIRIIKSQEIWDKFHDENPTHSFLQSWNWGEFNESMGEKIFRLGIFSAGGGSAPSFSAGGGSAFGEDGDNAELVGVCLAIKVTARRGNFILVPHGPNLPTSDVGRLGALTEYLKSLAKKERCAFVRINPIFPKNPANEKIFRKLGFRKAPLYVHAELLWLLDISKSDDELLKGMRKTTRYSIRKAESDGVTIEKSEDIHDLDKFNEVYKSTFSRQHFVPFSKEYLENEFKAFSPDKKISIFFAKYKGEIVSSAIIVYNKSSAFYHHGASNQKFPKITPTHLLQWEIIKDAKARGCNFYNFWGIAPENKPKHPMYGLSLFKKGFGGYLEELVPTQDLIITPKYWLNFIVEKIRKLKRGL